ncbi:hypothetical protein TNCV_3941571 [Trichonephila clavipes]|uniref:Uncharacterized protein n=1 Tax=Trichonephila clavipes TaxID=2585209 RepID=A0A8X6VW05_TRICX|nr:hypothetical protein TNCV_3941571 [Trichonephila clavipes]
MDFTSSSHLAWGRFLNRFRSLPTSLWPPPAKTNTATNITLLGTQAVEHTRAAEAPDEKRARLQADQVRHSLARAAETPEQNQVRLQSQQVRQNASRAAETPIHHVVRLLGFRKHINVAITLKWKAQMHDGFMYNPRNDYESNNLLDIGRMSNV